MLLKADAVVIDLRQNIGGDPNTVALLSSFFLADNTHLWSIIDRAGEEVFKAYSAANPKKYQGDVYLLTSKTTYSAAEAFVYTLKHLGRAVLVGESTGGGAHLVEMKKVSESIGFRIPVARAYSPITKSNWERIGVITDVEVLSLIHI